MTDHRRILLTGASGLIGRALTQSLESAGHEVVRLVRREPNGPGEFEWNPYGGYIEERALKGLDAVVHLSGAGIGDKRWTDERKRVLYDSRIVTTRVLAEHLAMLEEKPAVFVSQSAIGIYGDRGDEVLVESSPVGDRSDFLAALTQDWEAAAAPAARAGIRVVHPRTGIVLSRSSQLIARLKPLFTAGLGGPIGSGRQWWSWITLRDVIGSLEHLITSDLEGPVNLTAPDPVRQGDFAHALASALRRPALLPVPRFGMQLALGSEKAASIGFSSTRATPWQLISDGYAFIDPDLGVALKRIVT